MRRPVPTYDDAVADALEAAEAVRALAHATHDVESPEAAYRVLGALSTTFWSLRQSLDQLAAWHERNADRAITIDAPPPAGKQLSRQIANDLRFAALTAARAGAHVDQAWNRNGRIVWAPDPDRRGAGAVTTPSQAQAQPAAGGLGI
jgi:hypothetical protein